MKVKISKMLQQIHGQPVHRQELSMSKEGQPSYQQLEQILREKDREIERLRHALTNVEAQLKDLTGTDVLTGLSNHHVFKEHLTHSLKRALRVGYSLSLMIIDLDKFREVNLRYGHDIGDKVLVEVAAILKSSVREIDLPARFGGEELVAVLHETDTDGAAAVAERVRKRVELLDIAVPKTGKRIALTATLAVASYPRHGSDPQSLLEVVGEALIKGKAKGGNTVSIAES